MANTFSSLVSCTMHGTSERIAPPKLPARAKDTALRSCSFLVAWSCCCWSCWGWRGGAALRRFAALVLSSACHSPCANKASRVWTRDCAVLPPRGRLNTMRGSRKKSFHAAAACCLSASSMRRTISVTTNDKLGRHASGTSAIVGGKQKMS